ncbi:hypothetical protein DAPPUDRAFT_278961, partial [Daphnia pulex]
MDETGVKVMIADDEDEEEDDDVYEINDDQADEDEEGDEGGDGADEVKDAKGIIQGKLADEDGTATTTKAGGKELQAHQIDAFWLQRKLGKIYDDPTQAQTKVQEVLEILREAADERDVENQLVLLLGFDQFDFIRTLRSNRQMILYCTLWTSAQSAEEKAAIEAEMRAGDPALAKILHSLLGETTATGDSEERVKVKKAAKSDPEYMDTGDASEVKEWNPQQVLNLEDLAFAQGGHLMANKKCHLPDGSFRRQKKGYEEVHVPAAKPREFDPDSLARIDTLPRYAQPAFEGFKSLNVIQTALHKTALETDENLLICAPTGAGKTNSALLCMMREIGKHVNAADGRINVDQFKIIYIAPLKSLVQEM